MWQCKPEEVDKLWEIKTGEREPDELSENFKVLLGTYTETFNHECLIRYLVKRSKTAVMPLPTRDPSICNVAKVIPLSDMDLPLYAHLDAFITEDDWNEVVESYEDGIDLIPNQDGIITIVQEEQIIMKVPFT